MPEAPAPIMITSWIYYIYDYNNNKGRTDHATRVGCSYLSWDYDFL